MPPEMQIELPQSPPEVQTQEPTTDNAATQEAPKETLQEAQTNQEITQDKQSVETIFKAQAQTVNDAKTTLEAKGLNYDTIVDEYLNAGTLTDETYKALEQQGFNRSLVDGYIQGINATNTLFTNQIIENVGGAKELEILKSYVAAQGQNAIDAYDNIIEQGDLNSISMYLGALKAQMQLKGGTNNPSILGSNANIKAGFDNITDLTKAMSDERYKTSESYRKTIENKLQQSSVAIFK